MTLVYLSTGLQDTAFPSQVGAWLRHVRTQMAVRHFSMEPWRQWRASVDHQGSSGAADELIRCWPVLARTTLVGDGRAVKARLNGTPQEFVVHARGQVNACRARELERMPGFRGVVADLRGAIVDESATFGGPSGSWRRRRARLFERIEREAIERSAHVTCVSQAFGRWLTGRYGIAPARLTVVPSFVDTTRFCFDREARSLVRKQLGVDGRFVLVYAGGAAPWQMPEATVNLFRAVRRASDALLLWLTHRTADVQPLLASLPDADYRLLSVPQSEVPPYLAAADAGVLLREPALTNRVAAPIKFGEYLCCGLPVIVSPAVGDTAEQVAQLDAGLVVTNPNEVDWRAASDRLRSVDRERIAAGAVRMFGISDVGPRLQHVYSALFAR